MSYKFHIGLRFTTPKGEDLVKVFWRNENGTWEHVLVAGVWLDNQDEDEWDKI